MLALAAELKTNAGAGSSPIVLSHGIGISLGSLYEPSSAFLWDYLLGLGTIDGYDTREVDGPHGKGLGSRGEIQDLLGILPTLCRNDRACEGNMLADYTVSIQMLVRCHFRTDDDGDL